MNCDACITNDAEFEIVLAEGQCFDVCGPCIPSVIIANASEANPVWTISSYNTEEEMMEIS